MNKRGPTKELVKYLTELTFDHLPEVVINKAKLCLLDYLGHTLYAYGEKPAQILLSVGQDIGGKQKEARIIGYGTKTDIVTAAMLNGAMGHMAELDDTHRGTMSHPGDSLIAAALAVAEKNGNSGQEIIAALAAGYEITIRAGESVMPTHYYRGWHPSATINTFGAAIVAGKLLGLDVKQMCHCIGIAGAMTCGNFAHIPERGMVKDFNTGRAAASGVYAALLAKQGFTGSTDFFENDRGGFCRLYADSSDLGCLTRELGKDFKILEVAHKPYTACRHAHAAIDATLILMQKEKIKPESVLSVKARIFATGAKFVDDKEPWLPEKGLYGSRFSSQFNVAVAMLRGEEGIRNLLNKDFVYEMLNDPSIRDAIAKIDVIHDRELDKDFPNKWATIVEIETTGGLFSQRIDYPKGEPEWPVGWDDIEKKFNILTEFVGLPAEKARSIVSKTRLFETLANVNDLMSFTKIE
ncbi:MAG: MmgE/PrpD family protein [bacterium]